LQYKNGAGEVVGCLTACGRWQDNEGESLQGKEGRGAQADPSCPHRVLLLRRSRNARCVSFKQHQVLLLVERSVRPASFCCPAVPGAFLTILRSKSCPIAYAYAYDESRQVCGLLLSVPGHCSARELTTSLSSGTVCLVPHAPPLPLSDPFLRRRRSSPALSRSTGPSHSAQIARSSRLRCAPRPQHLGDRPSQTRRLTPSPVDRALPNGTTITQGGDYKLFDTVAVTGQSTGDSSSDSGGVTASPTSSKEAAAAATGEGDTKAYASSG